LASEGADDQRFGVGQRAGIAEQFEPAERGIDGRGFGL
jgi:hypothetical protein